jgi:hypothetical protein
MDVTYIMRCDMNKEIEFESIVKRQSCSYDFYFATKWACQSNFISHGSNFNSKNILIYLIIIFSMYCVGFSFMNYRNNPEDGLLKSLPHREFWRDFIENAGLGAGIIVKKIKEAIKGNKDEYNNF